MQNLLLETVVSHRISDLLSFENYLQVFLSCWLIATFGPDSGVDRIKKAKGTVGNAFIQILFVVEDALDKFICVFVTAISLHLVAQISQV